MRPARFKRKREGKNSPFRRWLDGWLQQLPRTDSWPTLQQRTDSDGDGSDRRLQAARVLGLVGEAVRAKEVGGGRVHKAAVCLQGQVAVLHVRLKHGLAGRGAVGVGGARQHAGRGDGQGGVLVHSVRLVDGHGRVVVVGV